MLLYFKDESGTELKGVLFTDRMRAEVRPYVAEYKNSDEASRVGKTAMLFMAGVRSPWHPGPRTTARGLPAPLLALPNVAD
eukprot:SAG22_NODE_2098_length_3017_cov_1.332077_3_plen_81_part_00